MANKFSTKGVLVFSYSARALKYSLMLTRTKVIENSADALVAIPKVKVLKTKINSNIVTKF